MRNYYLFLVAFFVFSFFGYSQEKFEVTGTVIDESGIPLPGVNIVIEGTQKGGSTDFDGKYVISAQKGDVMIFSFIGYKDLKVTVSKSVHDVNMAPDSENLDEVVITALGIKRSQKSLGYSSTVVKNDELTKGRTNDVVTSLQGKIAGVEISNAGATPGGSQSVVVRGVSSLGGNNQPLYIIDGIPITNSSTSDDDLSGGFDFGSGANAINPDDVESMNVLKGSAATALYGSRAANGVIIITTKSGTNREGASKSFNVNFSSSFIASDPLRLPDFQNQFGQGWDGEHILNENGSWGPAFDGEERLWGNVVNNSQLKKPYVALEDNVRDFYERGKMFQNSISLSGGNDKTTYYFSYSNVDQDGIFPTDADSYTRNTLSARGSHKVKNLTVSTSINYANQKTSSVATGQGLTVMNSLTQTPRDISIVDMKDYETNPFYNVDNFYTPYGVTNPYYILDNFGREYDSDRVYGKVELSYNFLEDFNIIYRFGGDFNSERIHGWNAITIPTEGSPNGGSSINEPGKVFKETYARHQINHDLLITYDKDLSDDYRLSATAGLNSNERGFTYLRSEINNLDIPGYYTLSNSSLDPLTEDYEEKRRIFGAFVTAELAWKETVFLTLNARNDWSSTLPKDNNSFFYSGAALSYLFTEHIPKNDILTFGKLRLAVGQTGNDADPYRIDPVFIQSVIDNPFRDYQFPVGGQNAFEVANTLGNQDLQPEISTEVEVGGDLRFWKNRLQLDVSYYYKKSTDQIYNLPLAASSGYTTQTLNIGNIKNQGVELLVGAKVIDKNDFNWDITYTFTKNYNEVESLADGLDKAAIGGLSSIGFVAIPGEPIGLFEGEVPERDPQGRIVVDANGLPVAASEKEIIGDSNIDWAMGLNNVFSYKGLTFSFAFDFRKGGVMYSRTADVNYFVGNAKQTAFNDRKPFVVPNSVQKIDNTDGSLTYVENTTQISKSRIDDYWNSGGSQLDRAFLVDRGYIKLREVALSYRLPKNWLDRTNFFTNASLGFVGRNLFIWTPESNTFIDPESSTFGNDLSGRFGEFGSAPTTRSYGVNLKLAF